MVDDPKEQGAVWRLELAELEHSLWCVARCTLRPLERARIIVHGRPAMRLMHRIGLHIPPMAVLKRAQGMIYNTLALVLFGQMRNHVPREIWAVPARWLGLGAVQLIRRKTLDGRHDGERETVHGRDVECVALSAVLRLGRSSDGAVLALLCDAMR